MKKLFEEFNPVSTKAWEELILKDLKGADYSKKLITKTYEGIDIKPFYRKENIEHLQHFRSSPGEFPFVRTNKTDKNHFKNHQDIIVSKIVQANLKAVDLIQNGINSIGFDLQNYPKIENSELNALLMNINLEHVNLNFTNIHAPIKFTKIFILYTINQKYNPEKINGFIDFDPLSELTLTGICKDTNNFLTKTITELFQLVKNDLPKYKMIGVNASHFKNAGASSVQELAFALSIGNEYLANFESTEINIEQIAGKMKFTFGITSHYFMEIAKIRAARLLWSIITETYGLGNKENAYMNIHSVTGDYNKTVYDAHVNILRTTTEAASGILGGTDSICVKPFNSTYTTLDDFSVRIAKNIPIILQEEAYFDKVIDPAGGSWFIESLTASIAEESWKLFLEIEKVGGYIEAFKKGIIKAKTEETTRKHDTDLACRKEILLGTNLYPDPNEKLTSKPKTETGIEKNALKLYRSAETFELLRQKTELAKKTPKVFLLPMGDFSVRKARANFSAGFFACAGFEILENQGFNTVDEAVASSIESKADITVICSSDEEYPDIVPCIYEKLKNNSIIVVAGYPQNSLQALKNFGIKHFIHIKSNIPETIREFQTELGI